MEKREELNVPIRKLDEELEEMGFDAKQVNKILNWVDTIPIRIYGGNDIHVKVKYGIVRVNDHLIDCEDLSFNNLPQEDRILYLWDNKKLFNPFKIPPDAILLNPFTGEGGRYDGEPHDFENTTHYGMNPFNCKLFSKIEYKDGKAHKFWKVNSNNEWEEEIKK